MVRTGQKKVRTCQPSFVANPRLESSFFRDDCKALSKTSVILPNDVQSSQVYPGDDTEMLCSICLEVMDEEEGNLVTVPGCLDTFHSDCIAEWKQISLKCPICQGALLNELGSIPNLPPEDVSWEILTAFDIFINVFFSLVGIAYPLCLFSLYITLQTILFGLSGGISVAVFPFLVVGCCFNENRPYLSLALLIVSPFFVCFALIAYVLDVFYLFYWTLKFYLMVFMCKMRWSDTFDFMDDIFTHNLEVVLTFLLENASKVISFF